MKVLYVSKASLVPAYRDKLHALAAHVEVTALIPERWRDDVADVSLNAGPARVRTLPAHPHGHNHLHVYHGAAALLDEVAPDIVHIDEEPWSAVTLQFARLCRRRRTPFLFFTWQNLHKRLPPPFGALRRHVFATAAAAIAGTAAAADVLRRAGWSGAIAVVPQLGVSPARFGPDPAARASIRGGLGIPDDAFVAGFAGRLVPEKGVDLLIDAVALHDAHVLVVGDGPERRRLEQAAAAAHVSERTHFAEAVSSLDMPRWLNAMDVLVLPSRRTRAWAEQFGRVLIEAMACEVPVIGAISGEIPGVIGEAGLTFDEGDTVALAGRLAQVRAAPELRAQLGRLGRARVLERYTHERIAQQTVAIYDDVLAGHARGVRAGRGTLDAVSITGGASSQEVHR